MLIPIVLLNLCFLVILFVFFKRRRPLIPAAEDNTAVIETTQDGSTAENISSSESTQDTSILCDYEVFLSFCGKDTRINFTDCLYESLVNAGINTFRDSEQLHKGEKIATVFAAIENSKVSVPVLSKNYATREWCLHELTKIVECNKQQNRKILPIFYDVEPSVVREQSGVYELAFLDHEKKFDKVTVEKWRLALKEVASFSGWELQKTYGGYQGKLINEVISHIWRELGKAKLIVPVDIQRMYTYEEKVIKLLDPDANDSRIIVIYGKPSSGKTILAKCIYNNLSDRFGKNCCFLANINENVQRHGLESIQKQLVDKLLEGKGPERIHNVDEGINVISQRFRCLKILLLLDDVDRVQQFDALAKESNWFGLGSRIIVTTRNRDILEVAQVHGSFEITNPQRNAAQLLLKPIIGYKIQDATVETLDCLRDDEVQVIGIWGVGGVGKTTLALNVNDRIAECMSFLDVYWVTVSQNCSIYSLQEKIAERVGIDLSKEDDEILRSARLSNALQSRRQCVLILDDVWNYIPFEKVGISHSVKQCKLIMTSRSHEICQQMGCLKFIKVDALDEESAWKLFQENLGPDRILPHDITEIAIEVLKECDGLPLAIITMGSTMRGVDDIREWRDTLRKIKESKEGHESLDAEVFPILKYSYDCLKDRQAQQCFLHCAVYPEDFQVQRHSVIEFFIDLGLIKEDDRKAEFDRGHAILNKLENVSLLDKSTKREEYSPVTMHDLIRDMALKIKKFEFMVKAGQSIKEVPDEEKWTNDFEEGKEDNCLELVSLMNNRINDISISPSCPKLSALLLNNNSLQRISNCFFVQLPALKVLDLSETNIEELPSSVADLEKLTALILHHCYNLKVMPSLEKLTKLRKLDLCKTSMKQVPSGLHLIANLQFLDLFESYVKEVPTGIIPNLCRFCRVTGPSGEELAGLKKLECLWVWFYEWDDYCTFVTSSLSKPNIYYIGVGCGRHNLVNFDRYVTMDGVDLKEDDYFVLPEDAQCLLVTQMHNLRSLWDIHPESFETFSYLKQLLIYSCDGMKNVLDSSFVASLSNLEVIRIQDCEQVEEIIVAEDPEQKEEDSNASIIAFPKLQTMELRNLTNLKRITAMPLVCDNLNEVNIYMCPTLISLKSLRLSNPQRLKKLHLADCEQLEEMISTGQEEEEDSSMSIIELPKVQEFLLSELPNLKSFSVRPFLCVTLKVIDIFGCQVPVSLRLLCNLPNLEQLFVRECKQLEEIFAAAGQDVRRDIDVDNSLNALPKLQYLHLQYLPNLKTISTRPLACDSIKQLCITDCPKLKKIPFSLQSVNGQLSPPSSLKLILLQTLYKNYGELKEDNEVEEEFEKAKRWWGSLEWDDPNAELILRPFTQMQGEEEVFRKLSNEIATVAMQSIERC